MTEWRNWSGSVTAQPTDIARPKSAAEISAIVARARKVRVVGAGHSFMPLCQTDGVLISMATTGQIEFAPDRKTVCTGRLGLDHRPPLCGRRGCR